MRRSRFSRSARHAGPPAVRRAARPVFAAGPSAPAPGALLPFGPGLADQVPLILFSYDLQDQLLLHCNRHCQTVLGYSSPELLALGPVLIRELLHAASRAQLQSSNFRPRLTADRALSWDCRLRHRDGSWRWLRLRVRAGALGPDGQVREIIGSGEDVTRHRAALDELRQNRLLVRQVVDLMPNLIYIYDLDQQRTTYTNRRSEAILGYSSAEILALPDGENLLPLLLPEARAPFRAQLADVAQLPDGATATLEFAVRHRDGRPRWLHSAHAPFARNAAGRVISIIGVAEDVTARRATDEHVRAATEHLAEQHRLFRQVIDALPHPIYLKDGAGRYLLANEATAALFGLTPGELVQRGATGVPLPATGDAARSKKQDQQVLATGRDLLLEESYTHPDGRVSWFSGIKRLFVGADGAAQVLGVDSNITELKLTQRALEEAIGEAEVDARAKQDFLANMSHEIRTPLHGILGLTGVLAKTALTPSQQKYLRLLGDSAEHLLTVLNDVLTTARLGAGKLRPETTPFNPAELLTGCAELLRPRAREKELELLVESAPALSAVLGDAHRLRQILLNLVSNAIKFTHRGRVGLGCRAVAGPAGRPGPAGTVWLQFTVRDTGEGIAPETLDKIFEPFTQARASTDREYGGTGLGLGISEGLVGLLGGVLRVSSEVGAGSTFAFTLPFLPVPEVAVDPTPAPPPVAPAVTVAGHILLVEDNLVNSLLAETVLRNQGWQVTTAASGAAAIELFQQQLFTLVLMDIQMPGMDGETAARALREHPDPARAATPVIALTARAQAGEAERLQAAGFAGYLSKPYREEQLLEAMRAVLTRPGRLA